MFARKSLNSLVSKVRVLALAFSRILVCVCVCVPSSFDVLPFVDCSFLLFLSSWQHDSSATPYNLGCFFQYRNRKLCRWIQAVCSILFSSAMFYTRNMCSVRVMYWQMRGWFVVLNQVPFGMRKKNGVTPLLYPFSTSRWRTKSCERNELLKSSIRRSYFVQDKCWWFFFFFFVPACEPCQTFRFAVVSVVCALAWPLVNYWLGYWLLANPAVLSFCSGVDGVRSCLAISYWLAIGLAIGY